MSAKSDLNLYYGVKSKALQLPTRRFRNLSPLAATISLAIFASLFLPASHYKLKKLPQHQSLPRQI